jgi:hypothetical protein
MRQSCGKVRVVKMRLRRSYNWICATAAWRNRGRSDSTSVDYSMGTVHPE